MVIKRRAMGIRGNASSIAEMEEEIEIIKASRDEPWKHYGK